MLFSLVLYLVCGSLVGIIAGLFGVGGGTIVVPLLVYTLPTLGVVPEHVHHIALGTSLASIMVTSVSSARSHYKKNAVNVELFKNLTPGVLLGTFLGGIIAGYMPILTLKIIFIVFLFLVALQLLFSMKPKPSRHLPNALGTFGVGNFIGLISSFVGIGGGTLTVPFATFCNEPMHRAVGTSSAVGFPLAVAGTIGYIVSGWNLPNMPEFTLGYIHIIAFLGISVASFYTAPIGAKLSHNLPVPKLKRYFSYFLFVMAGRMLYDLLNTYYF